ncbi:MAG: hypothetical protein J6B10_09725 [Lachnospiraceae bacterium]|nr:hypothetical protein [Lachnospiraceae bacterium]
MSSAHENIHDEIKEQTKKWKDMTPKQKWGYFWEYYKIPTLVAICIIATVIVFVKDYIEGQKETLLYAVFVNSNPMNDYEQLAAAFASYADIDLEQNHVTIDSSVQSGGSNYQMDMASTQKMMAMVSAGTLDVFLGSEAAFCNYTDAGYFADLRTILPDDILKSYADDFYYYTYDPQAAKAEAEEVGVQYEESDGPYDTLEPVPIGIKVTALPNLPENTFQSTDDCIFGIFANSEHTELALLFLNYLEGK